MSTPVAVLAALGSAASAAVASALQHRSASDAHQPARATVGVLGFVRSQLRHRLWWAAVPVQALGLLLHATALDIGALALVQPLLVCAVVLALPLNHYLRREPVAAGELLWAGLLVAGVAGFLATSAPGRPVVGGTDQAAAALAVGAGAVAIAGCWVAARWASPIPAAALLGTGAAIAFTGQAAFLQAVTVRLARGPVALLSSDVTWGLLAAGIAGVTLTQLAFRAGPLAASLPIVIVLNPVLGVVVGVFVDHETLRHTPVALAGELCTLALLCAAGIALTRREHRDEVKVQL